MALRRGPEVAAEQTWRDPRRASTTLRSGSCAPQGARRSRRKTEDVCRKCRSMRRRSPSEAAKDGIELAPHQFEWASEPGHLAVAYLADQTGNFEIMQRAEIAVPALTQMFNRLKGLMPVLHSCRVNMPYMPVLVHMPSATLVEVDDVLHFTTGRLTTLDLYPAEVPLGFDIKEYKELCREHAPTSDKWRYGMASKMFGFHGATERARVPGRGPRPRDLGHGPSAADPRPGDRRRRRRRLRPRARCAAEQAGGLVPRARATARRTARDRSLPSLRRGVRMRGRKRELLVRGGRAERRGEHARLAGAYDG